MFDQGKEPRKAPRPPGHGTILNQAEVDMIVAEREAAKVRSEQLEWRARMATFGGAAFGVLGLVVCGVGLLWFRDIMIGTFGAGIGMVGFGVVTVAQWAKMRGGS